MFVMRQGSGLAGMVEVFIHCWKFQRQRCQSPNFLEGFSQMPIVAAFTKRDTVLRMQMLTKGFQYIGQFMKVVESMPIR